ncbi:MAG: NAD(P)-dependent oxidoreductase [Rhizobiaceae bacterium]
MKAVFVDANEALAGVMTRLLRKDDPEIRINRNPDIKPDMLPDILGDTKVAIIDHTHLPTPVAKKCAGLRHVVFLGTGPGSYMDVQELAELGISVHIVKGYGDTAVAECAVGLMWAAAKGFCFMDREMRAGQWMRTNGVQLSGKTLGLVGFGSIAAEVARIATGIGMRVVAWNRSPKVHDGVEFIDLDHLLSISDVVSMHLLLTDETRGLITRESIRAMKNGAILVNTARGALVDEDALMEALRSGHLRAAGLDVYPVEPMPAGHPLTALPNVVLSAHSAFRTPEASDNLINTALDHCRRIATQG